MLHVELGDHLGMESYDEMKSDLVTDLLRHSGDSGGRFLPTKKVNKSVLLKKEREFPPPLPCIPLMENLKRYYTDDGRLVIREEKTDYLRARRSNGRLMLELIKTNDGVLGGNDDGEFEKFKCLNDVVVDEEVESESCMEEEDDDGEINGVDEVSINRTGVIGGGKCYRYNSWGVFDIGSPTIRPVHI